jgi:hypothetical protein
MALPYSKEQIMQANNVNMIDYTAIHQTPTAKDFNNELTDIRNARSANQEAPHEAEQEQDNGFEP